MAIDTPAKIAVIGAGPLGLEAALYARFLGYDVEIFERGDVAERVRSWGHVRMFSSFDMNRSTLGLAALEAHDPAYAPPDDDELLTYGNWARRYLLPLSQTDLLADHLRTQTEVLAVGKDEIWKSDLPGHEDRGDYDFRLLVCKASREEIVKADAVLDATGPFAIPNWLGQGGIPAAGEMDRRGKIEYALPDVLSRDHTQYAGKHTLVVGSGHAAATSVTALAKLAEESPGTRITWITRREPADGAGPVQPLPGDTLAERDKLAREANLLATSDGTSVTWWPATFVDRVYGDSEGPYSTLASGRHAGEFVFDRLIANVGHHCNDRLTAGLQTDPPEPNFYRLEASESSDAGRCSYSAGLARIREIFAIIGDRANLDLYAGAQKLVRDAQ